MQKIFVLDTNVLLHDPLALNAFHEHKVVVPMTVLEELDDIKDRRDKGVSREARIAINLMEKALENATPKEIQEGVPLTSAATPGGVFAVFPDQIIRDHSNIPFLDGNPHHANDNRIINVALQLQAENPETVVCLVTKDINMRLKAKGSGLEHVEDYRKDKMLDDIDLLAKGFQRVEGSFWSDIGEVSTTSSPQGAMHVIDAAALPDAHPNMFIIDSDGFVGYITKIEDGKIYIRDRSVDGLMNKQVWGLRPRNIEQAMAIELLQDPEVDLVVLNGPAGSGKTLLALACGLQAILEEKRFSKMIVARSTPPIAEDIGFLPGTEEEKMAPWLAAFEDNLEVLHSGDDSPLSSIEYVKERANIQFKSLNFMRGRSFNNTLIIIDEAQALTQFQLKSIITRCGADSKIVVLGNLAQIDNKYINPLTSGLTALVEKVKGFEHAGIMQVAGMERSRLAAFAEANL
ncbi:MAG TPA: PhoH family protein [Pseudomonadales bacterium]|nr:PhoH family protein [Pseudomonadales bacterium]